MKPIVEGAKEDTGFTGSVYCDEWCPYCGKEVFNIPGDRVSLCPYCGAHLFPCAICSELCDWGLKNKTCHRFSCAE